MNIIIHDKNMEPVTVMKMEDHQLRRLHERGGILFQVIDPPLSTVFYGKPASLLAQNLTVTTKTYEILAHLVQGRRKGFRADEQEFWIYQCDMTASDFQFTPVLLPGQIETMDDCRVIRRQLDARMGELLRAGRG